jgi:ATP-binding cassette subfamily C protein
VRALKNTLPRIFLAYLGALTAMGRWRLVVAIGLVVGSSLAEGMEIAVFVGVLQAMGLDLDSRSTIGAVAASVKTAMGAMGLSASLAPFLILYVATVGARSLLGRVQAVVVFAMEQRFMLMMRERLCRAIANADWLFVCRARSTDFTQALTEEAGRLGEATLVTLNLAADLIVSAIFVLFALTVSIPVTLMVIAAGLTLVLLYRHMVSTIHDEGLAVSLAMKELYAATIEQTQNLKLAKAYGGEARMIARFCSAARGLLNAYSFISRKQAEIGSSFEIGSTIALCVMLYVAAEIVHLPSAAILALLLVFSRLMPRFLAAGRQLRTFAAVLPAFETVADLTARCEAAGEARLGGAKAPAFGLALRFEGVSFAYDKARGEALHDVDLVIEPGSVVALAGPSGSGKSTLIDLGLVLLAPATGRILIGDIPLTRSNARSWREQIGYVGPETPLFHASIRANLLWAQPDATDAQLLEALRSAAAEDLVLSLPDGLDTPVGDRGVLLSQGERQRIGLARALLRQPRFLVLDEATNNLDSETETMVLNAISQQRGDMTVLLVAHRLSTLKWADRICVLENGRIVEMGSFDELSSAGNGRFRSLSEAQWITREAAASGEPALAQA